MTEKRPIKEEQHVHDDWYIQAGKMTLGDLPEFLRHLTEDYGHDYGTICHAIAAAAIAAGHAVNRSPAGGITGFQAGCIFWSFYEHWMHEKGPARMVKYADMLYPQYEDHFGQTITVETWKWLQDEAKKKLAENPDAAGYVIDHWRSIRQGTVPFGFAVSDR